MHKEIREAIFEQKRNVYISGVGGTGKSYQMKLIYEYAKEKGIKVELTSTTGVSAFSIGGKTIQKFSGITSTKLDNLIEKSKSSNESENMEKEFNKIVDDAYDKQIKSTKINVINSVKRWTKIEMLMIDEISMIGCNYIDLLNSFARKMRKNNKPFGGIQIVCSGDLLQLPPVNDAKCYESLSWKDCNFININLTKAWRQEDDEWAEMLKRIRKGILTVEDLQAIKSRKIENFKEEEYKNETYIYPKIDQIQKRNKKKLNEIKHYFYIIKSEDECKEKENYNKYSKEIRVQRILKLKIGCRVMLIRNLNVKQGLVNGSQGILKKVEENFLYILFDKDKEKKVITKIKKQDFVYIKEDEQVFKRTQFPIVVAYALSIHKLQGSTLDRVVIDIGEDIFEAGQTYVALSRCKSLQGIYLINFDPLKVKVDKETVEYEDKFMEDVITIK
jgi:ATP-dependent DNA helicase PIF1